MYRIVPGRLVAMVEDLDVAITRREHTTGVTGDHMYAHEMVEKVKNRLYDEMLTHLNSAYDGSYE